PSARHGAITLADAGAASRPMPLQEQKMSAEPPALDVDELYTLHVVDQLLACLDDTEATVRRIQAQHPQLNNPNLGATLALLTRMQQHLAPLTRSSPPL